MTDNKIGINFRLDHASARILMRIADTAHTTVDAVVEIALATYIVQHELNVPGAAVAHTIDTANRDPRLQDKPKPEALLTAREAAKMLAVAPKTLEIWRTKKTGPKFTRGPKQNSPAMYAPADLRAFIAQNTINANEWMTPQQAAAARGVVVGTVANGIKAGALKSRKVNGKVFVARASLDGWKVKARAKRAGKKKPAKAAKKARK